MRLRTSLLAGVALLSVAISSSFGQPPGGGPPSKQPPGGRRGPGPGGPGQASSFDNPSRAKDDAEKKILDVLDKINKEQGRMLNVPPADGRMLRLLAETLDAKTAVEIGTSNGISAIWTAMALKKTGGELTTLELDKDRAALARKNFAAAGVDDIVTVVVGDAHETVTKLKGPIDLVFIDADKEGYPDYLKKVLPLVRPGGLICATTSTRGWPVRSTSRRSPRTRTWRRSSTRKAAG